MKHLMRRSWLNAAVLLIVCGAPAWGQSATPTATNTNTPTATPTSTFLPARTPTQRLSNALKSFTEERGRCLEVITASDSWADACTWAVPYLKTRQFAFSATRNTLDVQILCSLDGGTTFPVTDTASFQVATSAVVGKTSTTVCTHLKVQTKPNGAGANGTLQVEYMGASY